MKTNAEIMEMVLELLDKGTTFLEIAGKIGGRDIAMWYLSYLYRDGVLCRGVMVEPIDPTLIEKLLILKWDGNYYATPNDFNPSWAEWCKIKWRLKPEWKDKKHLIPAWERGLFEIDPYYEGV